jgi:hypothetical protein
VDRCRTRSPQGDEQRIARRQAVVPVGGNEQHRGTLDPAAKEPQQVDGCLIRPVDVLHHDDVQRPGLADLAQQGAEELLAGGSGLAQAQQLAAELVREIEQRPERAGGEQAVARPQDQRASGTSRCSCSTSADFPTPASPATRTSRPSPCRASATQAASDPSGEARSSNRMP